MRREFAFAIALVAGACSSKKDAGGSGTAGSATPPAAVSDAAPPAVTCPPGSLVQAGACVAVITADKVAAVGAQKTRLDELGALLDKIEDLAAPVEVLRAFHDLPEWKALTAKISKLAVVDEMIAQLDEGLKQLRAFKAGLGEAATRLGNLKGELDALMTSTGAAAALDDVRTKVSAEVRGAIEPLATQVATAIRDGIAPISERLEKAGAALDLACASLTLSGGSDQAKGLCKSAKDAFGKGVAFLDEVKTKPATVFDDVAAQLETQLDQLIDAESKKAIDAAQVMVNDALKLPAGSGSAAGSGAAAGSGSGSGSGSAADPGSGGAH
ncbi:MAG: hypothetical protein K8W52_25065 [Deltaproteobacteria bacterium]|nr:hypothetical protein [Deltaproteobacteria bacterium]